MACSKSRDIEHNLQVEFAHCHRGEVQNQEMRKLNGKLEAILIIGKVWRVTSVGEWFFGLIKI